MSFWDSSALLPLCLDEPASPQMRRISREDKTPVVWWASLVECHSALERQAREGQLEGHKKQQAERLLLQLCTVWREVQPSSMLRGRAMRLLSVHRLRAADALQLAAALVWASENTKDRGFVCLDSRLREAAQREGFTVLPDSDHSVPSPR